MGDEEHLLVHLRDKLSSYMIPQVWKFHHQLIIEDLKYMLDHISDSFSLSMIVLSLISI